MSDASSGRRFTLIGLVVVIVVVGLLLCLLFPAVQNVREAARRASCISAMKMIGLSLLNYEQAQGHFPPSMLERPPGHLLTATAPVPGTDNSNGNGADFSWYAAMLPNMEAGNLYEKLDVSNGFPFDGNPDRAAVRAVPLSSFNDPDRSGPEGRCASFTGSDWSNAPEYPANSAAIGNYVALGATHLASLYRTETRPIGGTSHPNGVIYPGSTTSIRDIADGTTNTVLVCETREQGYAAWVDGTTAAVVGLAEQTHPTFKLRDGQAYYSPTAEVRTTINWGDDDPSQGKFYLPAADHSGSRPWVHGPSSFHPGVVNHLLGDGSVRSVAEDIDPALYMHLITRAGGEPVNEFTAQ